MRLVLVTAVLAALCGPSASGAEKAGKGPETIRLEEGRISTAKDGPAPNGEIAPEGESKNDADEGGIIPRQTAIDWRNELKPLTERISTRGMRAAEAKYAEELRLWAVAQHDRLLELQKIHTAHDRLKEYRDRAARDGDDTSRIDPRLAGMQKKLLEKSNIIREAYAELKDLVERNKGRVRYMSSLMETQQETAEAIIRKTS